MLNSWQNSAKRVTLFHFPAGLWGNTCWGAAELASALASVLLNDSKMLRWSSRWKQSSALFTVWTCLRFSETIFFHVVQDFPRSPNWKGLLSHTFIGTSGPTTRSTPCAFLHHLYDLDDSKCQLDSHRLVAPKGTVLGADRHFWTVRCVVRGWKLKWKVPGGGLR